MTSKYPDLEDGAWLYDLFYVQQKSPDYIAGIVGCSPDDVVEAIEQHGLTGPDPEPPAGAWRVRVGGLLFTRDVYRHNPDETHGSIELHIAETDTRCLRGV